MSRDVDGHPSLKFVTAIGVSHEAGDKFFATSRLVKDSGRRRCQLLHGSSNLSPLYPRVTNDLHVSTATSLRQSFL